jgi:hypothetical protein
MIVTLVLFHDSVQDELFEGEVSGGLWRRTVEIPDDMSSTKRLEQQHRFAASTPEFHN